MNEVLFNQTKMCIKSAPCLQQKIANFELNMFFFYTSELMLLTKFVPKSSFRWCSSSSIFQNYYATFAPNCTKKEKYLYNCRKGTIKVLNVYLAIR